MKIWQAALLILHAERQRNDENMTLLVGVKV